MSNKGITHIDCAGSGGICTGLAALIWMYLQNTQLKLLNIGELKGNGSIKIGKPKTKYTN